MPYMTGAKVLGAKVFHGMDELKDLVKAQEG